MTVEMLVAVEILKFSVSLEAWDPWHCFVALRALSSGDNNSLCMDTGAGERKSSGVN